MKDVLGLGAFYVPARLAIARSLAITETPGTAAGEVGRSLKGDTLFGTGSDLASWVSLLVEHAGRPPETLKDFQTTVAAHWARGLAVIAQTMESAKRDPAEFWVMLAREALPHGDVQQDSDEPGGRATHPGAIEISIGPVAEDAATGERVFWRPNAGGGSPHSAFMGGIGSGKTRTAIGMLRAIRSRTEVPLIAFDFKGDMVDADNALDVAFSAQVISPPHQPIPLDFMALADRSQTSIALAAQRLRDSLSTLKGSGFGALQKDALAEAAERALRTRTPCQLTDLRDALKAVYADRGRKDDGAVTTLNDLCRLPLFSPDLDPRSFFSRSWIIRLSQDLPDLVRVSVVTLVTDALDRYLNSLPDALTDSEQNRALRVMCVIDEAHRILGSKLPGLSGLIRLSRSKGGAIMLISQSPEDFSGEDDDFLSEMGLVASFATNASPQAVRRILGPGANLATLQKGQAWVKLRGETGARRITAWR